METAALIFCITATIVVLIASVPLTFLVIDDVKEIIKKWKKGK